VKTLGPPERIARPQSTILHSPRTHQTARKLSPRYLRDPPCVLPGESPARRVCPPGGRTSVHVIPTSVVGGLDFFLPPLIRLFPCPGRRFWPGRSCGTSQNKKAFLAALPGPPKLEPLHHVLAVPHCPQRAQPHRSSRELPRWRRHHPHQPPPDDHPLPPLAKNPLPQASYLFIPLWVGFEYLHFRWELSWGWLTLGFSWSEWPFFGHLAAIGGPLGLSAWTLLAAALLTTRPLSPALRYLLFLAWTFGLPLLASLYQPFRPHILQTYLPSPAQYRPLR
jgi:hypothetical protein